MFPKAQSFRSKIAALSLVLVSESISATLILPFVGLFVAHIYNVSADDAGYLSGVLVSVFQLGQMLTAKFWGRMSDRFGRKPMIQMGLLFNAVVVLFFGISPNIYFCVLTRFLHGCANGNVLVAKTVIADITNKSNEGLGFATISLFWGVGSIVGPSLGGLLYDPVRNPILAGYFTLDENTRNIFILHPAFLPAALISVFSLFVLAYTCAFLPETSKNAVDPLLSICFKGFAGGGANYGGSASVAEDEREATDVVAVRLSEVVSREPITIEHTDMDTNICPSQGGDASPTMAYRPCFALEGESSKSSMGADAAAHTMRSRKPGVVYEYPNEEVDNRKASNVFGYREALRSPSTRLVLVMYMCIASTESALLEVVPLWAIASLEKGGLSFSSADLGWLMGAASVVCVIANVFFSAVSRFFNDNRFLWDISVIIWALTSIATPCAVFLPRQWIFTYVAVVFSIREIGLSWAYALVFLFIARSAPESHVGAMNGVAQSIGSLSRMVTMVFLPPTFAWSLNSGYSFPFNSHFAFWLTNVPLLLSYVLSSFLLSTVLTGQDA